MNRRGASLESCISLIWLVGLLVAAAVVLGRPLMAGELSLPSLDAALFIAFGAMFAVLMLLVHRL